MDFASSLRVWERVFATIWAEKTAKPTSRHFEVNHPSIPANPTSVALALRAIWVNPPASHTAYDPNFAQHSPRVRPLHAPQPTHTYRYLFHHMPRHEIHRSTTQLAPACHVPAPTKLKGDSCSTCSTDKQLPNRDFPTHPPKLVYARGPLVDHLKRLDCIHNPKRY